MDHWERRLNLSARSGAPVGGEGKRLASSAASSGDSGIQAAAHPDEAPVVRQLLELAESRPGFRAEVPLLLREGSRWRQRRIEFVHEVMGPVARAAVGGGATQGGWRLGGEGGATVLTRAELLTYLDEVLDRSEGRGVAVMLVDLDRFKLHNDALGDGGGGELLRVISARVAQVSGSGLVASLGGDELAVVLEGVDGWERPRAAAERIRRAVAEPVQVGGETVSVTATVGLALATAGVTAEQLLRRADTALFAGKDRGRDRVQLFSPQLEARLERQVSSARELRRSLSSGTLELHYQPLVALTGEEMIGAEALIRSPGSTGEDGGLGPLHLVDAAEDSGLIARLGAYVLEDVAAQLARWEQAVAHLEQFRVSVNVSPAQLSERGFAEAVEEALRSAGVPPARLSLELIESVWLGQSPAVDDTVEELVELGVAFGLDDFGHDRASLGVLRRFPLEFVKLDRELVGVVDTDERAVAIAATTVELARRLGFATVAVGVERETQRDVLAELGCDAAQGYLFAPPLSAGELEQRL